MTTVQQAGRQARMPGAHSKNRGCAVSSWEMPADTDTSRRTLDHGLVCCPRPDSEWPVLHICLDGWVRKLASNQALCIEHCVGWVAGHL